MKSKKDFPKALRQFAKEVGVPPELICDASGEQALREVKNFCDKIGTSLCVLEANTQYYNLAELYVGLLICNLDIEIPKMFITKITTNLSIRRFER